MKKAYNYNQSSHHIEKENISKVSVSKSLLQKKLSKL